MRLLHQLGLCMVIGVVALSTLVRSVSHSEAAQPGRLSGATIQEMIPGATVHMNTPVGTVIPLKFAEDGTVTGRTSGMVAYYLGASQDKGRWWVKGRRLCQQWTVWFSGKPKCIEIRRQGKKFHWKDQDGKTGTATIANRPTLTAASPKVARKLSRPSSLGVAQAAAAALPDETREAAVRAAPTRLTGQSPAVREIKKAPRLERARASKRRRVASVDLSPPLPARRVLQSRFSKTSSWTMRARPRTRRPAIITPVTER